MNITCPKCGIDRRYPPSTASRLKSHICRKCENAGKTNSVTCSTCGKVRHFRPATITRLKTHECKECIDKAFASERTVLTCPHCGATRSHRPSIGDRRATQSCLNCPRHIPNVPIPDTFDGGYVLGVIMGDGLIACLNQKSGSKTYILKLSVTSKAFADRFRDTLHRVTGHKPWETVCTSVKNGDPKLGFRPKEVTEYIVGLTNRDWYDRLKPFKKDRDFTGIVERSEDFRRGFFQGMLDSEGYINEEKNRLAISNKDMGLLVTVAFVAKSLGMNATINGPYENSRGVAKVSASSKGWSKTV